MIICDTEIKQALQNRQLIIDPPPSPECFSTTSVDLTLDTEFKKWKSAPKGMRMSIDPAEPEFKLDDIAEQLEDFPIEHDGAAILEPGCFVLGFTKERIELPRESRLAARVEGRSMLARLGIGVHITAPTIHADFSGRIALEFTNHSNQTIRLKPGLRVCQLIVEQVFGTPEAQLTSQFKNQKTVTGQV